MSHKKAVSKDSLMFRTPQQFWVFLSIALRTIYCALLIADYTPSEVSAVVQHLSPAPVQRALSVQHLVQLTGRHANLCSQASLADATKLQLVLNHLARMGQVVRFQVVSNHSVVFSLYVYHNFFLRIEDKDRNYN